MEFEFERRIRLVNGIDTRISTVRRRILELKSYGDFNDACVRLNQINMNYRTEEDIYRLYTVLDAFMATL
jgi:hypothetical protein